RATTLMIAEHERKKISALACIERILNPKDEFMNRHPIKDPDPDRYQALRLVTPRNAALMIFAHMQDRENWQPQVTEKDLNNAFIDSLWHVQRGKHIDENGIDQNPYAPDNPSCAGGTINFLFNDMQAVLKDIKVNFVTQKEALSFTLPAITRRLMLEDISNQHEEQKYNGEEIIFADLPSDRQQRIRLAIKPRFYAEQKEYVEYFTERTLEKIFEDFESVALPYVTVHATQRA